MAAPRMLTLATLSQLSSDELFNQLAQEDKILNDEFILNVLKARANKEEDLQAALRYLEEAEKRFPNRLPERIRDLIMEAKKESSSDQFPLLTELTFRLAINLKRPEHIGNLQRGLTISQKIQKYSWSDTLKITAAVIFTLAALVFFIGGSFATLGASGILWFGAVSLSVNTYILAMPASAIGWLAGGIVATQSIKDASDSYKCKLGVNSHGFFAQQNQQQPPLSSFPPPPAQTAPQLR